MKPLTGQVIVWRLWREIGKTVALWAILYRTAWTWMSDQSAMRRWQFDLSGRLSVGFWMFFGVTSPVWAVFLIVWLLDFVWSHQEYWPCAGKPFSWD